MMGETEHDPGTMGTGREAVIPGTTIPVRLLQRAWRAGSTEADLRAAFPELPPGTLAEVLASARQSPANEPASKELPSPAEVAPGEQEDDAGFDAELEQLLETHAELFRRLAR